MHWKVSSLTWNCNLILNTLDHPYRLEHRYLKKIKACWIFIMSEGTYKHTFLSGGVMCLCVLAHICACACVCAHTYTETWKPFAVFRNIYQEKFKADWTEYMIHLTCLQFVVLKWYHWLERVLSHLWASRSQVQVLAEEPGVPPFLNTCVFWLPDLLLNVFAYFPS